MKAKNQITFFSVALLLLRRDRDLFDETTVASINHCQGHSTCQIECQFNEAEQTSKC